MNVFGVMCCFRVVCFVLMSWLLDAIAQLRVVERTVFSPTHEPIDIHCDVSADCPVVVSRR